MTYPTRTVDAAYRVHRRAAHWGMRWHHLSLTVILAVFLAGLIIWVMCPPIGSAVMFGVVSPVCTVLLMVSFVLNQRRIDQLAAEIHHNHHEGGSA